MSEFLPPEIGPWIALGLMAASFGTSFLTAAFGIGGGAVLLGILAVLMPPAALIPVHGVVQLGSNAGRTWIMRAHIRRDVVGVFLIGTLVGVALGGLIAVDLPAAVIQIGVGLFILWSISSKPPVFLRSSAWLAGGASSFLTMFFGATGPFVAAYVKTLGFEKMDHVGTHAACMTLQHMLKVVAFGLLGFAFGPYLLLIAGMIVFGFAGTVVGRQVLAKIDEAFFKRVLNAILILLSLRLIWAGVSEYL